MFDLLHTAIHGAIDYCVHREKADEPQSLGWVSCIAAGSAAFGQGKYDEAERHYREAIRLTQQSDWLDTLLQFSRVNAEGLDRSLYHLGRLYDHQKRFVETEEVWRWLLELRQKRLGPNHSLTANCHANLASALLGQEKRTLARAQAKTALGIHARASAPNPEHVAFAHEVFGAICLVDQDWAEAEAAFDCCLGLREKVLRPGHPDVVRTTEIYAALLAKLGRHAEADDLRARLARLDLNPDLLHPEETRRRFILQGGTPVTAAVVTCPPALVEPGEADHAALVLFSFASGIPNLEEYLAQLGERLVRLIDGPPRNPDEQRVAGWLRDASFVLDRRRQLPFSLTEGRWVYLADLWVSRADLPGGVLSGKVLRCAAEQADGGGIELVPID
jgi:tetratricopeptide (TPR) repeat protein